MKVISLHGYLRVYCTHTPLQCFPFPATCFSVSICPEPLRRWGGKEEVDQEGSTMVVVAGEKKEKKEKGGKEREAEEVVFF